ncbi:MAG: CBS domain-containing protein [Candidatus Aenigmarchaeota archaeon]|nr:CBS domain-containing protein [Candidatus Aenigmarchaeota archaeon]
MVIITGEYLKDLRKKASLSQAGLAKRVGVSQAHVAKIEGGKVNPTLATVNKILLAIHPKQTRKCGDIMERNIKFVSPGESAKKALSVMRRHGISQLPVISRGSVTGSISEGTLLRNLDVLGTKKIGEIMEKPFPTVDEGEGAAILPSLLEFHSAVLVSSKGKICGIITKLDVLR